MRFIMENHQEEKSISIAGRKIYEENFSQVIYAENIIGLVKKSIDEEII